MMTIMIIFRQYKNIEEVKVVTRTVKEISQDIIVNTIDYMERAYA